MSAATVKRKAAPRKAARKGAQNGAAANGAVVHDDAAQPGLPPAEKFDAAAGLYGGRPVYRYQPVGGGDEIVFPHISTVEVDAYFFWRIYELNEMFQAFEWMKQAGVPRSIQERLMQLPADEQARFFSGWFDGVSAPKGVSPPGE